MRKIGLLLLSMATLAAPVRAADPGALDNWPQWRGPLANGMAPHADPPLHWDASTNVKWKAAIPGRGSATPIVWGDQVFVVTAFDTGRAAAAADVPKPDPRYQKIPKAPKTYYRFLVLSLDRRTGKILWQRTAAERVPYEGHQPTNTYASASPTTDGRYLYVSFGSQGIYCYDLDGRLQWQRDLGRMETRLGWGEGSSPVIHRGSLIINWDHEAGSFITALDARTGKTRWKTPRDEPTSWNTPLLVEHNGQTQIIVNGTHRVRSYDFDTGRPLWQCGGQTVNAIPSPVADDSLAFCMSGFKGTAAYAIPLDATGDITGTDKIAWHYAGGTPYVPSPLLSGDRLYFTQGNNALLTCLEARSGRVIINRVRLPGVDSFYASPICAAGRIYLVGRDGTTLVIRREDKLAILATNRLDDPIDASPVVVGKQLFLRGQQSLYCVEE